MHISDGVLPTSVVLGTYAASILLSGWSVKTVASEDLPKTAVVTSSFFVASLVHVPLGPTSVHLLLPGLVGVLLGPASFLSITLGLFLQSILFQFGGLTAVGANALMMGVPALICGFLFPWMRGRSRAAAIAAGSILAMGGTALSAVILALLLSTAGESFFGVAKLALVAHIPVFFVEGIVSAFTVSFLSRVKPELLRGQKTILEQRHESKTTS